MDDKELLEREVKRFSKKGWLVVSQTDTSAQLKKPKRWSKLLLWLGLLTLIFLGAGLIFFAIAAVDYALQKEKTVYLTVADIKAGKAPKPTGFIRRVAIGLAALVGLLVFLPMVLSLIF